MQIHYSSNVLLLLYNNIIIMIIFQVKCIQAHNNLKTLNSSAIYSVLFHKYVFEQSLGKLSFFVDILRLHIAMCYKMPYSSAKTTVSSFARCLPISISKLFISPYSFTILVSCYSLFTTSKIAVSRVLTKERPTEVMFIEALFSRC